MRIRSQVNLFVLSLFLLFLVVPEAFTMKRFNGGMFYHIGFYTFDTSVGRVGGIAAGLGGRAAISLLPSLMVGGMGYSTRLMYESDGVEEKSVINAGFGGLTFEVFHQWKLILLSGGLLIGGGVIEQMHLLSKSGEIHSVMLDRSRTFLLMPYLITQIPLNERVGLSLMVDYPFGTKILEGKSSGPKMSLGLLFSK